MTVLSSPAKLGSQTPQTNVNNNQGSQLDEPANESLIDKFWSYSWAQAVVIVVIGVFLAVVMAFVYYCKVYENSKKRSRHQSESREPRVHKFSS